MHVAPIDRVKLDRNSTFRYRYWLVIGDETEIASRLDALWKKYSTEQSQLVDASDDVETSQHYVSPGVHYLINPNTEFGGRVACGLNDQSADFFVNAGFGWMF
jgi:hypothetical protein